MISAIVGTPNTNPSATPVVFGGANDYNTRVSHPAFYYLPTSWDPTQWYAQAAALTGAPGVLQTPSVQDGTPPNRSWTKTDSAGKKESLGVTLSAAGGHPLWMTCGFDGFDPQSAADVAEVEKILATCAGADIPGGDASAAVAWVEREGSLAVDDLDHALQSQYLDIPTPEFGDEVLFMTASDNGRHVISLTISSPTLQQ